jgi:NTP pyrophosphatase (non-canonical NTP hydrolase)
MNILEQYKIFVDGVTSETSKNNEAFIQRIKELDEQGIDIARLITGFMGLSDESNEGVSILKKVIFHGKPFNEDNLTHIRSELCDCLWYIQNICIALDISIEDAMVQNIKKLEARYPGGKFSIEKSENRSDGDI